jgi:hypothetical protein
VKKTEAPELVDMILVVPTESGELLGLNFDIEKAKQFSASALVVEKLREHCIPVAVSSDYNLLLLDL